MRSCRERHHITIFWLGVMLASLTMFLPRNSFGQETTPYLSSPRIEAEAMPEATQKNLAHFLGLSIRNQTTKQLSKELCRPIVNRVINPTPKAHVAQALVESDIATEVTFARDGHETSYTIEFMEQKLLLYSSAARYESERQGVILPYPSVSSTTHWFESKADASVMFIIPPITVCGVHFVLACPRSFNEARELVESHFTPSKVRYFPTLKADGLLKAPETSPGKVQASGVSSERVALPATWYKETTSSPSPSSSFRLYRRTNYFLSPGQQFPITLPFRDALEAHLGFGIPNDMLRVGRARNTIEMSEFPLKVEQPIRLERSDITLKAGACFLITSRKESHYS